MLISFHCTAAIVLGVMLPFLILASAAASWYYALKTFKKQIKDNPIINEQQIKDLYKTIGRKPSEKQIQQIMANFKN